ncbi:hypothetical protein BpHYR1_054599, partial [Brachionus plicatilis]
KLKFRIRTSSRSKVNSGQITTWSRYRHGRFHKRLNRAGGRTDSSRGLGWTPSWPPNKRLRWPSRRRSWPSCWHRTGIGQRLARVRRIEKRVRAGSVVGGGGRRSAKSVAVRRASVGRGAVRIERIGLGGPRRRAQLGQIELVFARLSGILFGGDGELAALPTSWEVGVLDEDEDADAGVGDGFLAPNE